MRVLTFGMTGEDVKKWQTFLASKDYFRGNVDGQYDGETVQATKDFQRFHELQPAEGAVTNVTLGMAMVLGFPLLEEVPVKGGD
jgi:peptidoglycan hydrolase-like protein with peptidoglycan-binding domain